jgi:hypothetical protein
MTGAGALGPSAKTAYGAEAILRYCVRTPQSAITPGIISVRRPSSARLRGVFERHLFERALNAFLQGP